MRPVTRYRFRIFVTALTATYNAPPARALDPAGLGKDARVQVEVRAIVDGDTFTAWAPGWDKAERIRPLGYDTPELPPRAKCAAEAELARAAKAAAVELLRGARVVELSGIVGRDVFGRVLAHTYIDGRDLGPILIGKGLAKSRKGRWCPPAPLPAPDR